jgi:UrcA family protein
MNHITTLFLTTVLAASAQLAFASDAVDASRRHTEVHFADLSLSTPAGMAALYQRLHGAAQEVCREDGTRDLGSTVRVKACVTAAVSAAVTQINNPALTAYYRARFAGSNAALLQASR